MKTLKLNQLERNILNSNELSKIKGGSLVTYNCGCGCAYADSGGSTTTDNGHANARNGLSSGTANDKEYIAIITLRP